MKDTGTIKMMFVEPVPTQKSYKESNPVVGRLARHVVEVSKEVVAESFARVASEVAAACSQMPAAIDGVVLDEVSVALSFDAETGLTWIASATAVVATSTTLTFKIRPSSNGGGKQ